MLITMLLSAGVLVLVVVGMLLIMSKRIRELPRAFEPPVARTNPDHAVRTNWEDD